MVKKSRSGSGMNIPDHISESFETILWAKILKFFNADADPDPGILVTLDPGWKKFESAINIPDPQRCC
jgi:hypothetical protein